MLIDLFKKKKKPLKEIYFIALDINYVMEKPEEIKWFYASTHCCGMQNDKNYAYFGYLTTEMLDTAYQLAVQRYPEQLLKEKLTDEALEETIDYNNARN